MQITSAFIDDIYEKLCRELQYGQVVGNTHELMNVQIELTNVDNNIVCIRNISPTYLFGEMLWYFDGRNDLDFISKFSTFWNKLSDDGRTCNSAYGFLMKYAFGFDQIEKMIDILKKDPNSRRAKINLNTPRSDVDLTKDEPCTMFLQFTIRNNKLNCTTVMRSNDIWFGFPYDVAFFTELQKYIADKLNVMYGTYTHFVTSLHVYDRDYEKILEILKNQTFKPIKFNRIKFHEYCENLADEIANPANYWVNRHDAREQLLYLLDLFDIYKEKII